VVGAVFLDLRKAFDTVNHQLLINKLSDFSLDTNTIAWIQSYLKYRQQCVAVDNTKLSLRPCSMGVPQGSILAPLLFTLYINDLPTVSKSKITMYADKTVVCTHGKPAEEVTHKLTKEMKKVSLWLKNLCLTLNLDKTRFSVFLKNRYKILNCTKILIDGQIISFPDEV